MRFPTAGEAGLSHAWFFRFLPIGPPELSWKHRASIQSLPDTPPEAFPAGSFCFLVEQTKRVAG